MSDTSLYTDFKPIHGFTPELVIDCTVCVIYIQGQHLTLSRIDEFLNVSFILTVTKYLFSTCVSKSLKPSHQHETIVLNHNSHRRVWIRMNVRLNEWWRLHLLTQVLKWINLNLIVTVEQKLPSLSSIISKGNRIYCQYLFGWLQMWCVSSKVWCREVQK